MFAGCHSLRRAFGSKWARKVSHSTLKRLMRHASIATTESYYVHLDAADLGQELWRDFRPKESKVVPVPTPEPADSCRKQD